MVKFCIDRIIDGKPYPNLAVLDARPYTPQWRKFSVNHPYSEPVHFFEYLDLCDIPYKLVSWTQSDRTTFYPISISYFDFSINWFDILPVMIREKLRSKTLSLWFFYSEGDNPTRIRDHILSQFIDKDIDHRLIQFVSANSAAERIKGFHHFVDDECLYQLRNRDPACDFHDRHRSRKFTALVRTHKWWRATTMTRLWADGYHDQGYFSYNKNLDVNESEQDNPIEIDSFENLRFDTYKFLENCPFTADDLNSDQHNLYATTVTEHFENSYLNVILETHLDADQSGGVFLTEKTFKPIKNCQPFIIFGCAGSIQQLRSMGYRTFDHVIDHSYDLQQDNTQRWELCYREFQRLMRSDLHSLYLACREDLMHNQQLFLSSKSDRLNTLLKQSVEYATNSQ
jgi:hypothetical protein